MFLVGPVVGRLGERKAVLLGAVIGALGFAWYGWAPTGRRVGAPVFALCGLMMPGLQGLMSRRVPPNEQGQLQGATQSLQGIASIFGPLIFGETFARALRHDASLHSPGLPVYLAGGLPGLAFLLALTTARAPVAEAQKTLAGA